MRDFETALDIVRPTVLASDLNTYQEWDRQFGCHSFVVDII